MTSQKTTWVSRYLWPIFGWLIFAQMALMIVIKNSYNLFAVLCLLISLLVLVSRSGITVKWDRQLYFLTFTLIASLLLVVLHWLAGRDTFSTVQKPLIALFILPITLAIIKMGMNKKFLYIGLSLGAIASAITVGYQHYELGIPRAANGYNPVPVSQVSIAVCGILLAAGSLTTGRLRALYIAGSMTALFCVFVSAGRGSLLALPFIIVTLVIFIIDKAQIKLLFNSKKHMMLFFFGVIFTLLILTYTWEKTFLKGRFELAITEVTTHMETRNSHAITSVGIRFELWYAAWIAFKENPWLGIGSANRIQHLIDLDNSGVVHLHDMGHTWTHTHSDYLAGLELHGLPGFLLVIGLYLGLFVIFIKGLRTNDREQFCIAMSGLLSVIAYSVCSLTDTPLRTNLPLVFFHNAYRCSYRASQAYATTINLK